MDGAKGWWVVAGSLLALAISAGTAFFVLAIIIPPMMEDTGWSLTEIAVGVTLWGLVGAAFSPFCGRAIDRFGARPVMLAGTGVSFVALLLLARVQSLPQLYVVMALAAVGAMANTYIPIAAVVTLWFVRLRSVATGIAMLGLGIGGAIMPQLANALLKSYSWREVLTILAFIALTALLPILALIRNPRPNEGDSGGTLGKDGLDTPDGDDDGLRDLAPAEAARTRSFWGISLGDALTGLVFAIFTTNFVVYMTADIDLALGISTAMKASGGGDIANSISSDRATNIFSVLQLCIAGGTFVFGALANVLPIRAIMILCYSLPALAAAFLLPPHLAVLAYAFAIVGGLAGGGRQALFPVALAHSFGPTHVGAIYGMSNSFFLIGNAAGPIVGALLYEGTGSTGMVYGFAVVVFALSALLIALMRGERKAR